MRAFFSLLVGLCVSLVGFLFPSGGLNVNASIQSNACVVLRGESSVTIPQRSDSSVAVDSGCVSSHTRFP